jgi:hypothetical protein
MKRLLVTTAIVTGAMFFHPTARADILSAQSYFDGGATTTLQLIAVPPPGNQPRATLAPAPVS